MLALLRALLFEGGCMDAWSGISQLIVITCAPLPHQNVLGCEVWHKTYSVVSESDAYTTSKPMDDWVKENLWSVLSNKEPVRDKYPVERSETPDD